MMRRLIQRNRKLFLGAAMCAASVTLPSSGLWAWAAMINPYGSVAQSDWMMVTMLVLAPALSCASLLLGYAYCGSGLFLVVVMFTLPLIVNVGIAEAVALLIATMREMKHKIAHNKPFQDSVVPPHPER